MTTAISSQRALGWSFVMNGGREGLTGALTLLLAALLGPTVFGTIGMALVYVLALQMVVEHGFGVAIVQRKELTPEHLDATFWTVVGGSLLLAALGFAASGWWATVNRLPELETLIDALLVVVPLQGLTAVQQAVLQRDMDFRALAIRANASVAAGGAVGVALALSGYGVWALVAQQVVIAFVGLLLVWRLTAWRPRLAFSGAALRDLLDFSGGTLLGAVGIFVNNRSDVLFMGIFFGPTAVGIFRLADRLVSLVVELTARSVQVVALSEFSRLQDRRDALRASVLRSARTSALLCVPTLAVLAAAREEITQLLGPKWADAAAPIGLLCVAGMVRGVTLFLGPVMQALGRPHLLAGLLWAYAIPSALAFLAVSVLLGDAPTGAQTTGIAASRTGLFVLVFLPVNVLIARRLLGLNRFELSRSIAPAVAVAAAAVAGVAGLRKVMFILSLGGMPRAAATLAGGAALAMVGIALGFPEVRRFAVRKRHATAMPGPTQADEPGRPDLKC